MRHWVFWLVILASAAACSCDSSDNSRAGSGPVAPDAVGVYVGVENQTRTASGSGVAVRQVQKVYSVGADGVIEGFVACDGAEQSVGLAGGAFHLTYSDNCDPLPRCPSPLTHVVEGTIGGGVMTYTDTASKGCLDGSVVRIESRYNGIRQ